MTRIIFTIVILVMAGVNVFLFQENRKMQNEKKELVFNLEKGRKESEAYATRLDALAIFFEALENPRDEAKGDFEKAIRKTGSENLVREYEKIKEEATEEKMITFCRLLANEKNEAQ